MNALPERVDNIILNLGKDVLADIIINN